MSWYRRLLGEDISRNGLGPIIVVEVDRVTCRGAGAPSCFAGQDELLQSAGHALESTGHQISFQSREDRSGRSCWTACGQEQVRVRIALLRPNDPHEFVLELNIRRRHLAARQRRELISKLLRLTPDASDRQIAARANADHKTVARIRAAQEVTGEIPQLSKRTGVDGRVRTTLPKPISQIEQDGATEGGA